MMKKTINTENIIEFASCAESYLLGSLSLKELNESFSNNISDDEKESKVFFEELTKIEEKLTKDLAFYMASDPAANSEEEVRVAYPGYKAIAYYRTANILFRMNKKVVARIISERAHLLTGIDIHPGAQIGCPFFIDHGTGIVIGETSVVGDYVKMYQGVTLGALSLSQGAALKGQKRHPTIKNHVTIYANASILGGDVVIGNNVIIGSNVFLYHSVDDNSIILLSPQDLVVRKK